MIIDSFDNKTQPNFELYNFLVTGDVLCENSYDNSKLSDANHNLDKLQIALKLAVSV